MKALPRSMLIMAFSGILTFLLFACGGGGGDEGTGDIVNVDDTTVTRGGLVSDFGNCGVVTSNPATYLDDIPVAVLTEDNGLYVIGFDQKQGPGDTQWRIEKHSLLTGKLLSDFGNDGVVTINPSPYWDGPNGAVSDGTSLYVVGFDRKEGDYQWRIEKRSLATGDLDTGFDVDGIVTNNPSSSDDKANAVATDGTALYIVGYYFIPPNDDSGWRIEKRSLTTGALIPEFGEDGVVSSNLSAGKDVASSVVVHDTSLYVVGRVMNSQGYYQWRIEKRDLTTGELDPGFDDDGVVTSSPSQNAQPLGAISDGSDLYLAGYGLEADPADEQWLVEKYSLNNGAYYPGFGTDGVVSSNPSVYADRAMAMVVDGESLYVVGNDASLGDTDFQWRLEGRNLVTGDPIDNFGISGVVAVNPSTVYVSGGFREAATAIATDGESLYVVGIDNTTGNAQWRIEKRQK